MIMPTEDTESDDVRNVETAKLERLMDFASVLMRLLMAAPPGEPPEELRPKFNLVFDAMHPCVISDAVVGAAAIQSGLRTGNGRPIAMRWDPQTEEYVVAFERDDGSFHTSRDPVYFMALAETCEALQAYATEQDKTTEA